MRKERVAKNDSNVVVPSAESVLATLQKDHPRLMLTDKRLAELKKLHSDDKRLRKIVRDVLRLADKLLDRPVLTYDKRGPRLLHISRRMVQRTYALGLAWRWSGKKKYLDKLVENLLAVCEFKDWNPSHFLDTAEMSHAVGVGYDWLYPALDEQTRLKIKAGLIRNGLKVGVKAYNPPAGGKQLWWCRSPYNWNQVCNGGLLIGALAVSETDPQYAGVIVPNAVANIPKALEYYAPDGAWPEGPGYWSYATAYTVYALAALETALGGDFGLSKSAPLSRAGDFPIYCTGPTGYYLNYADSGEFRRRGVLPCLFWLGRRYGKQLYIDTEHAILADHGATPHHLIWYAPPSDDKPKLDLDKRFGGPVELAIFRGAWNDPRAIFVGVKAGFNQVNHGHLDLGNFELDAMGVRWARDLGSEDYNLPGYWGRGPRSKRWTYYRLKSVSHNVPVINGKNQDVSAEAKIVKYRSSPEEALTVIDLTGAYKNYSSKTLRGVALTSDRRAVLVRDEFDITKRCKVSWGMTTDAKIDIRPGGEAVLTLKRRRLIARILEPAEAVFSVESAGQKPPLKPNEGVSRLVLHLDRRKGPLAITILLVPSADAKVPVKVKPIKQW